MILELENIEKSFGAKNVLRGMSFRAESGKAFGLLGRNGAGKTTSIRILMDVIPSDSGRVLVDGAPIDRKHIKFGYLPEERGLYPKRVVFEQLVYLAQLNGLSRRDAGKAVDFWLDRLEMSQYRMKTLDTLSKGNQQKIQLVTALAHDPQIVILDEPFSGLDPVNAALLKDVVREQIAKGKIVLFSSHQMSYIEEFCDNIAIINEGKIALQGDLREIKHSYARDNLLVRSEQADAIRAEFGGRARETERGELLIHLSSADEKQNVMKCLAEKYDLDEIKVYEPSLNDIFVEYAGNGSKEE